MASFDRACKRFINKSAADIAAESNAGAASHRPPTGKKGLSTGAITAVLLAKYSNLILAKGSTDGVNADAQLDDIITVLKFLDDSDYFHSHYTQNLTQRLLSNTSTSDDLEAAMISRFKALGERAFATKLEDMFKDITLSKQSSKSFKEVFSQIYSKDDCFDIKVLTTAKWKLAAPKDSASEFQYPPEFLNHYSRFSMFYQDLHKGKQMGPAFAKHCTCVLIYNHTDVKYTITMSLYTGTIVLQFNNALSMTLADLVTAVGLEKDAVIAHIKNLVLPYKLVTVEGKEIAKDAKPAALNDWVLNDTDIIHLNHGRGAAGGFKSNKKVFVLKDSKSMKKEEDNDLSDAILQERQYIIQAAIVRAMKKNGKMNLTDINQYCMADVKQFRVDPKRVKTAIDFLLGDGYMTRDENSNSVFHYKAETSD
jgi:hypothetical protein